MQIYNKIKSGEINYHQTSKLRAFGGFTIETIGTVILPLLFNTKKYNILFHVISESTITILGFRNCLFLQIISINNNQVHSVSNDVDFKLKEEAQQLLEQYKDVFDGDGCLSGPVSFEVDENITPKHRKPRRIPVAIREDLKKELDNFESRGIITPLSEHTDWISKSRKKKLRL